MPECLECGFKGSRLQWTHFKYKCTGRFKNGTEYRKVYPNAELVDEELRGRTAVTLKNLQRKYGDAEGQSRFEQYKQKQADTNSFAYKQEKYGWTEEEFKQYNKSRAITLKSMIMRHGEENGTVKWLAYCDKQRYTNTIAYFIEKYGDAEGTKHYHRVCDMKAHTVESVTLRHNCNKEEAISILQSYKTAKRFSSNAECKFAQRLEEHLGEQLDYSVNTKQYCVYNDRAYFYDIVHNKRAIEFNGDYWHCNPKSYNSNFYHEHIGLLAEDIWNKDKIKIDTLKEQRGIETKIIWESEYNENESTIIEECVKWLKHTDNE